MIVTHATARSLAGTAEGVGLGLFRNNFFSSLDLFDNLHMRHQLLQNCQNCKGCQGALTVRY